jgi:hypothetical protein
MKTSLFSTGLILLIAATIAWAGPSPIAPRIIVSSETPALRIENVRIDPNDGKVRGTAYVNFGYATPFSPRVHVFALASSGNVLYESCDRLSRHLLARSPRLHRGRDSFSASLPAGLRGITTIKVVASNGHDGCKLNDNRLFTLFNL